MKKILIKIKNFFKWIWQQVKDWHNLAILFFVAASLFLLCVFLLGMVLFFTDGKFHFITAFSLVFAFWAGPFTPFWPLCIAITLFIRKIIDSIIKPKKNAKKDR